MRKRTRRSTGLLALDLFAGAGGLSLGLKWAGFRVIGAIENNELAVKAYRRNHPGTRIWAEDIRKVSASAVARSLRLPRGRLDLLAGCPPCQSFSVMQTRNWSRRVRDRENKDLLFEFLRFIRGLLPKTVMLENVPGLARDSRLAAFRRELRKLGYSSQYQVLDAADYGVPQRRRRLILVAGRYGVPQLPHPTGRRQTVKDAIGYLQWPTRPADPLHKIGENRSAKVRDLIRRIPKNGGSRADLGASDQLPCHRRVDGFKDVYGRMAWGDVAPTITCGFVNPSKGRFLHPTQNRAITLREGALLQTFPRRYFFPLDRGKFAAAELIGNALPPKFVKQHAVTIKKYIACSGGFLNAKQRAQSNISRAIRA